MLKWYADLRSGCALSALLAFSCSTSSLCILETSGQQSANLKDHQSCFNQMISWSQFTLEPEGSEASGVSLDRGIAFIGNFQGGYRKCPGTSPPINKKTKGPLHNHMNLLSTPSHGQEKQGSTGEVRMGQRRGEASRAESQDSPKASMGKAASLEKAP